MSSVASSRDFLNGLSSESVPFGNEDSSVYRAADSRRWTDEAIAHFNAQMPPMPDGDTLDQVRNAAAELLALPYVVGCWFSRYCSWNFSNKHSTASISNEAWCVRVRTVNDDDQQFTEESLGALVREAKRRLGDKFRPRPGPGCSAAEQYAADLEDAAATDTQNTAA